MNNDKLHRRSPDKKNIYKEVIKNLLEEDKDNFEDSLDRDENKPFNLFEELEKSNRDSNKSYNIPVNPSNLDISINLDYNKGLKLTIIGLRNFKLSSRFKITGGLMEDDKFIIDENARDCVFGTKSKILNDLFEYRIDKSGRNLDIKESENIDDPITVEENIVFNEEFYFLRNLPGLIIMKQNNFNLFLVIQIIGFDDNASQKKNSKFRETLDEEISKKNSLSSQKNKKESFNFVSWYVMKLNRQDGTIIEGKFLETLYKPPMIKPPYEGKKLLQSGAKIEFILEEYIYNTNTLKKHKEKEKSQIKNDSLKKPSFYQDNKSIKAKKNPNQNSVQNTHEILKSPVVQVFFKPFIENKEKQHQSKAFGKGSGIDIYIDGARFLPDNATITKV